MSSNESTPPCSPEMQELVSALRGAENRACWQFGSVAETNAARATSVFSAQDLLDILADRIVDAGSLRRCAKLLGVSPALLSRVMSGKLALPPVLHKALGFQRRTVYELRATPTERTGE